jgi:hypothetical protein
MNLRFTPLILICIAWSADGAFADGGLIRAQRRTADHLLTVFTSPTPLRAGPVDISIRSRASAAPNAPCWFASATTIRRRR